MSIISRVRTLFKANVNTALDSMEDPVKGLEVTIEDMRREIADAKKKVAASIAQEKSLKLELEEAEAAVAKWDEKAATAVKAQRDDLAKDALKEKGKAQNRIPALKSRCEHFQQENARLKDELHTMESQYEQALARKEEMVAKAKVADARSSLIQNPPSSLRSEENQASFSRAERKIRQKEADAQAAREISDATRSSSEKFDELERLQTDAELDDELEKLKEKLNQ